MEQGQAFSLGGVVVEPGGRAIVELPVSYLANGLAADLRVLVVNGRKPGPVLAVSAAVHGDEVVGVEIIRRLMERPVLKRMSGTLLLVPIVNGYGFLNHSRYLPDRRDLNRCFPGSASGSLAGRLAHVFLSEVISRAELVIDLHSAAIHRENLPQVRVNVKDARAMELARAFGAPVILRSPSREGSLRQCAGELGVSVLLFEGGEALRFSETTVRSGLSGIMRVMHHLGMISSKKFPKEPGEPFVGGRSYWLRAPSGGMVRLFKKLGDPVAQGERIGAVSDPFGLVQQDILSLEEGVIIGRTNQPLVNEGDALIHVARAASAEAAADLVEHLVGQLAGAELFYEDEII